MDNIFKDLDYSDISTKYFQNKANNNKTFGEIEIKKGKFGLIKLIIFLILFLILIILIIVVISKNSNIKSLEQKIKENNEQLNTNKNILEEKNKLLNQLLDNNIILLNNLYDAEKQKEEMKNYIKSYSNDNNKLKIDIKSLEKDVEDLQQELKIYNGFEKSELLLEFENLEEKIERLRQMPM